MDDEAVKDVHPESAEHSANTSEETPSAQEEGTPVKKGEMSLIDHLQELRHRLIVSVVALLVGSGICYLYAAEIVHWMTLPVGKLYYMNPAEAFFTYLRVSFFAGLLLALPIILYQFWMFILPALTKKERTALLLLVPASVVLFFVGIIFSYILVLPAGIRFFMGFSTESLQPFFSLGEYTSFVISMLLPFGFIFEIPMVILVLAKLGLISSRFLQGKRKVLIVLSFVIGAVVAPTPDIFSQTMVAIPLLVLYEISILAVKYLLGK